MYIFAKFSLKVRKARARTAGHYTSTYGPDILKMFLCDLCAINCVSEEESRAAGWAGWV